MKQGKLSVFTPALCWSFDTGAYVRERNSIDAYESTTKVDPTPCYSHDKMLVEELLAGVAASFPIEWSVAVNILPHETHAQTNGWASYKDRWKKGGGFEKREGAITLAGKRIPPHPAVTRYLVAHEYGHIVDMWISNQRGFSDASGELREEYRKMRGVKKAKYYGPGQWHACVQELFANDFRILVAQREEEFWPHPGFERPEELPQVVEWWQKAKEAHSVQPKVEGPSSGSPN